MQLKRPQMQKNRGKRVTNCGPSCLNCNQCLANECWKNDTVIDREPNSLKNEKTNTKVITKSLIELGSKGVRNLVDESICHPRAKQEKHCHRMSLLTILMLTEMKSSKPSFVRIRHLWSMKHEKPIIFSDWKKPKMVE